MKRLILVAAGGLLLSTANSPPTTEGELSSVVAAPTPSAAAAPAKPARSGYPRCSASVRDRCVQGRSAAAAKPRHREVQLAMRAGERG